MMHGRASTSPTTARPGMTLAVWCLMLGGLFAMHGLSSHGAGTHGSITMQSVYDTSDGQGAREHEDHRAIGSSGVLMDPHEMPGDGSLLTLLCLAVVGGILIAVVLALLRHIADRSFPWALSEYSRIGPSGRDRDPPCLTRLSVMRC